ncbi:MAG: hypothetical protein ACRDRK_09880 [Pseudonocardia sp.]
MTERGGVTRALRAISRSVRDDRTLAGQICRACVDGLDIDGAAIALFTASTVRENLYASHPGVHGGGAERPAGPDTRHARHRGDEPVADLR